MRDELVSSFWSGERTRAAMTGLIRRLGKHPALTRFQVSRPLTQRLLVITAPPGAGREWFAASWLMDFERGFIVDLSQPRPGEPQTLAEVEAALEADEGLRIGVVVDATTELSAWHSTHSRVCAGLNELLLTRAEADGFLRMLNPRVDAATLARTWDHVGGWLSGLYASHRYGLTSSGVQDVLLWIVNNLEAYTGRVADYRLAAFLDDFSADLVAAFYGFLVLNPPTVTELAEHGLLVSTDTGWQLPSGLRAALKQHFWDAGADEGQVVTYLLRAIAQTTDIATAVAYGMERGEWDALADFLDEYWMNVFTEDPAQLLSPDARLPGKLSQRFGGGNLALRMLSGAVRGTPEVWRFSPVPYEQNPTVRSLQQQATATPTPAGARTLTLNLLLMNYLRLSRSWPQAAEQARRLRDMAIVSNDHFQLNPLLFSFIDAHVGVCLLHDLDVPGAEQVFAEGYTMAAAAQNHFLAADIAGKYALLLMLDARYRDGVRWYKRAFAHADQAPWGQDLIQRCAHLARGLWQLNQLNYAGLARTLKDVSSHPQDLFWEIELYLQASMELFYYKGVHAVEVAEEALAQDRYKLSPLGEMFMRAVTEISWFKSSGPHERFTEPTLGAILFQLSNHDLDGAARLLTRHPATLHVGMWDHMLEAIRAYLRAADLRDAEGLDLPELARHYRRLGIGSGSLLEVLVVSLFPGSRDIHLHLGLSEAESSLVTNIGEELASVLEEAPELTGREQAVLDLLRQGLTRAQIATSTFRSENTVKAQMRTLYRKLGANSRDEALRRARIFGL